MTIPTAPTGPRKSQSKNVFIGCLIALGICVVIVGIIAVAGYWFVSWGSNKFVQAFANEVRPQIVADINDSNLPAQQKAAAIAAVDQIVLDLEEGRIDVFDQTSWINSGRSAAKQWVGELGLPEDQVAGLSAQIDRLADGTINETIGQAEWDAITQSVGDGALSKMITAWALKMKYIYPSAMSSEDKAAAEATLDRIARGVVEDKITEAELQAIAKPYETIDPQSGDTTARDLTNDELNELLGKLATLADENEVPQGSWQPDYAAELRKAIDKGLGVAPATP